MRYKLLGLIIIVLIVAGVLLYLNFRNSRPANQVEPTPSAAASADVSPIEIPTETPGVSASPETSASPAATPSASPMATPTPDKILRIDVDDTAAGQYQSSTKRGALVRLTFNVMTTNVASGGLDFRSSVISTGPILPGQSKTISFVANSTVVFTPYGVSPATPKPYAITINVY